MNIHKIIVSSVKQMLDNTLSDKKIEKIRLKHDNKVHFVPYRYRILGGLLQSLNIQFGNFIETLVSNIIKNDNKLKLLPQSGTKNAKLSINDNTNRIIDEYITKKEREVKVKDFDKEFNKLLNDIFDSEIKNPSDKNIIKHDIDLLFEDTNGIVNYMEFKYTDDHDTGKFLDINRKFLKTYAGLINLLQIKDQNKIFPFIYYFNNIVKKQNHFINEDTNILRGEKLFDKFLQIKYSEVSDALQNTSEDTETAKIFDDLYNKIRYE